MKNSVYGLILRLVSYGINTGLIEKEDIIYTQNRLLSLFNMDEPDDSCTCLTADNEDTLEEILSGLLDYAYEKGIIPENTVTYRDLFDVKLMASLVKRPSEVIREFWQNYSCSPKLATDSYYKFSCDTDYIRRYRIKKDLKWKTSTEYGDIDITVNLSKPEKDPKAIAAAKLQKQLGYPKCLLCKENEGYAGRVNHPARDNHRIIPLTIDGDNWFMQYSPYANVIDYDERYKAFDFADCVISATSGPHYTVTYYDLKNNIKTEKSRLFIDLAVPPDIDENIPKISGVRLINIDCIKQLANENNALKLDSVESAKEIIFEEIEVLKKDLAFHEFLPCMQSVKNAMPSDFSEKFIYKLKSDVSAEEFARILEIYRKCGENN